MTQPTGEIREIIRKYRMLTFITETLGLVTTIAGISHMYSQQSKPAATLADYLFGSNMLPENINASNVLLTIGGIAILGFTRLIQNIGNTGINNLLYQARQTDQITTDVSSLEQTVQESTEK